jgi:hypothetical protein
MHSILKKRTQILVFFVWGLYACSETFDNFFPSYSAASDAGAFSRGWVPDWIPKSATEIYETHNLDTNLFMVKFLFPKQIDFTLPTSCKSIAPTLPPSPPFKRKWWPSDVPALEFTTLRHAFYLCKGENANKEYVAISSKLSEVYIWQSNLDKYVEP